jgi:2,3-bisphosphoglycerate-dependent phosphoglycerate mutase
MSELFEMNLKVARTERHAVLIRHAESEGNIGMPTDTPAGIRLTEKGHRQAAEYAAGVEAAPDLIVVSPFLRTQQTAAPLMVRFPEVPVEIWPVQEFTYLNPVEYAGTTQDQRGEVAKAYWARCDEHWNDGGGAESFVDFIGRIDETWRRLQSTRVRRIAVFTHGYFMKGFGLRRSRCDASVDCQLMAAFRDARRVNTPANTHSMMIAL